MTEHKLLFFRGMATSTVANVLGMVASLVTVMIAARVVTKEQLGAYFLILVVVQIGATLGDIGMRNTVIQVLASVNAPERTNVARYLQTINLSASIVAACVIVGLLPTMMQIWPYDDFRRDVWLAAPATFAAINFQMACSILVGARKFGRLAAVNGGAEIVRAGLSILCLLSGMGIAGMIYSLIVSRLLGIIVTWWSVPSQFGISFRHARGRELLGFGGWLYGSSVVSVLTMRSADVLLTSLMGPAALAIYNAAMQLPVTLQRLFEGVRPLVLGYVATQSKSGSLQLVTQLRLVSGALALAAAVILAGSQWLMTVLYSQAYIDGLNVMRGLSVWAVISIVNYFLAVSLIGQGRARAAFLISLPQMVMALIAIVLLVPQFGAIGACAALVVTSLAGCLLTCRANAGADCVLFGALCAAVMRAVGPICLMFLCLVFVSDRALFVVMLLVGTIALLFGVRAITPSEFGDLVVLISRRRRALLQSGK